jgi:hypothetical protein
VLRFLPPGGEARAFDLHGDPGLVRLDPRWHQAALRFVHAGFLHIVQGADHLLFVLCLVVPFRRFLPLAAIVTAFTVAHSITLIMTALGYGPDALWFPPLIELLIAASIFYMAAENVLGSSLQRRWIIAFAFGLVHGFGFAYGLQQLLQFAGSHLYYLAPRVQRRRRARPAPRPDRPCPAAQLPLPLCSRARRHDHPLASRGSHGLALAPRALGAPEQISLARARRRHARQRNSLAYRAVSPCRVGLGRV